MNPSRDEQILLVVHKHWVSFALDALFIACPGALIVLFLLVTRSQFTDTGIAAHALLTLLVPLSFLILWIILCALWTMYYLDALVVTDRRIFYAEQQNMVNRSIAEWNIENARVSVRISGVFQSLFKYGPIIIETEGQEPAPIPDI